MVIFHFLSLYLFSLFHCAIISAILFLMLCFVRLAEGGRKRSCGVQRSHEVIPSVLHHHAASLVKQPSRDSTDSSLNSISSDGSTA